MRIRKSKVVKPYRVTDGHSIGSQPDANVSDNQVAIELLKEVFSWQLTIQVCADAAIAEIRRLVIFDASTSRQSHLLGNRGL